MIQLNIFFIKRQDQAHIELLSELANLLGNPDFLKFIKVVSSREEFKTILKKQKERINMNSHKALNCIAEE